MSINNYSYGCLMVDLKINNWNELQNKLIYKNDIYNNKSGEFGLEETPHITVLYGFHKNANIKKLKDLVFPLSDINIEIGNINIFNGNEYDVIKFDIDSESLHKLNKILRDNFDYTTEFENYEPHMTIAYVKSGKGKKYIKSLKNKLKIIPYRYRYTSPNNKEEIWS